MATRWLLLLQKVVVYLKKWLLCYTGERQNALQSAGEASKKTVFAREASYIEVLMQKGDFLQIYKRCTIAVGVCAAGLYTRV